jgi:hypothetical protein
MSQHATTCHNMPQHATTCHNTTKHAATCHNMPRRATTCHNITQHATAFHNLTQHATTFHDMPQHLTHNMDRPVQIKAARTCHDITTCTAWKYQKSKNHTVTRDVRRIVLQIGQRICVLDWLTVSVTTLTVAEAVTVFYVNSHFTKYTSNYGVTSFYNLRHQCKKLRSVT